MTLQVGDRVEVEVGLPAHGGHCVARHAGQVLFVRHGLPGELVVAEVTSLGPKGRFVRADAIEVIRAHEQRVAPVCPWARPGGCGGCDWQHASQQLSQDLKTSVLHEAMSRFAKVNLADSVLVADAGGAPDGLGWRTRADLAVDGAGRAGLRRHRSNDVMPVGRCPLLLDPGAAGAFARSWEPDAGVRYVAPARGPALAFPAGQPIVPVVWERAAGRDWQVGPEGFWQVHPRAADVLVEAVGSAIGDLRDGDRVVDLYCGVGLLGGALAWNSAGRGARFTLVESDRIAAQGARANAGAVARVVRAAVSKWLPEQRGFTHAILDPPRAGAGREVMLALADKVARTIVYVACDPVALARDAATLMSAGWELADLVAFDLFPNTQHFECVAKFVRRQP